MWDKKSWKERKRNANSIEGYSPSRKTEVKHNPKESSNFDIQDNSVKFGRLHWVICVHSLRSLEPGARDLIVKAHAISRKQANENKF